MSFVDFNLDGWDDLTVANASGELHFHAGGPRDSPRWTWASSRLLGGPCP